MSYTASAIFSFGASQTGLSDLRVQPRTIAGATTGSAITTGFTAIGMGVYAWTGSVPDDATSLHAYRLADATVLSVRRAKVAATIATGDLAADAITAASVKADAVTKIQAGLSTFAAGQAVTLAPNAITAATVAADAVTQIVTGVVNAAATVDQIADKTVERIEREGGPLKSLVPVGDPGPTKVNVKITQPNIRISHG